MARVTVQVQSDGKKKGVSKLNYNELNQLVNQLESDVNKVTIQIEKEQQIFEIDNIKRARVNYNKFKQKVK